MGSLKFLTREQKEYYKENGFIKLAGLFTENEIKEISDAYNELFERKNQESCQGLEAAWKGDAMKKITENVDYTVRFHFIYLKFSKWRPIRDDQKWSYL